MKNIIKSVKASIVHDALGKITGLSINKLTMSASNESTEWHLTPSGWIAGNSNLDHGGIQLDPPQDRVLTVLYSEHLPSGYSKLQKITKEIWRYPDKCIVDKYVKKYGPCPQKLKLL